MSKKIEKDQYILNTMIQNHQSLKLQKLGHRSSSSLRPEKAKRAIRPKKAKQDQKSSKIQILTACSCGLELRIRLCMSRSAATRSSSSSRPSTRSSIIRVSIRFDFQLGNPNLTSDQKCILTFFISQLKVSLF